MDLEKYNIIDRIKSGSSNRLRESYIIKYHKEVHTSIMEYTSTLDLPFKQRIWHWVNKEDNYIVCKSCSNRVGFNMNWSQGYKVYCSNKCSSNDNSVRDKMKLTNLEKWGVEHYSQTDEYVDKVKSTSLSKWGVDNFSKTDEFIKSLKTTSLEKWGVDSYTKTDEYKSKSKQSYLKNWGVEHYSQTDEFKVKFREKMIVKFGKESYFSSEENRKDFKISNHKDYIRYLGGSNSLFSCDCGGEFIISTDNFYGLVNNITLCTICNPIGDKSSIKEVELYEFIRSVYSGEIIRSYRQGLEIDIYLPQLKIGFEFNGIWWHSDMYKDKWYHQNKTEHFNKSGIRIINIWEDDWSSKKSIIKSQIVYLLGGVADKIFSRNCKVLVIDDVKLARSFIDSNHIQGFVRSDLKLGLYHGDELVSIMTFDRYEGRKMMDSSEWNINRFCSKCDSVVVGAAGKLLNFFIKNYDVTRIISYADRDWSFGNLYLKLGFKCVNNGRPDYKYVSGGIRIHKSRFRKSITGVSENSLGLLKIWDCGKIKFELIIKKWKSG